MSKRCFLTQVEKKTPTDLLKNLEKVEINKSDKLHRVFFFCIMYLAGWCLSLYEYNRFLSERHPAAK